MQIVKPQLKLFMDNQIIKTAILNALSLLYNELESVSHEELEKEYKDVINQLEKALIEIDSA